MSHDIYKRMAAALVGQKMEQFILRKDAFKPTDEDFAAEGTSAKSSNPLDEAKAETQSNDKGENVNIRFKSLLSSVAQLGLDNYNQNSGVKKYCGKEDERLPPQFVREFESSVLRCLDDFTKGQYFATVFDYDSFVYGWAIPFDKGYEEARKYFLKLTWNDDVRKLETKKLTMSDDDRELFGYYDDYEELCDMDEASAIKMYIRATDCGIRSESILQSIVTPRLPFECQTVMKLGDYSSLESFAEALHRHCVVSKIREDCEVMDEHDANMYQLMTGKSYYTGETESDD